MFFSVAVVSIETLWSAFSLDSESVFSFSTGKVNLGIFLFKSDGFALKTFFKSFKNFIIIYQLY